MNPPHPGGNRVWEYLNAVLFTAVPNTSPYQVKVAVRDHLFALIQRVPSLSTKEAEYTHNDGRTVRLLTVEGTLPIRFQNNSYNIPVSLWLDENYPHNPPICYVTPTPDMEVKQRHLYVDGSGLIKTAYLREWRYTTSNLVDLADQLSRVFSQDPPLYARPRASPAEMGPPQSQSHHHQAHPNPPQYPLRNPSLYESFPHHASPTPSPNLPTLGSFQPPQGRPIHLPPAYHSNHNGSHPSVDTSANTRTEIPPSTSPPSSSQRMLPEDAFRERAFAVLVQRLTEKLCIIESHQMDKLQTVSLTLQERYNQAEEYHKHLTREREELGCRVETLDAANVALDEWLKENEGSFEGELDIDTVFIGEDALAQQAIAAAAEDLAIDDTLDGLDRALGAGLIPPEAYLKHVRGLCRQQFMHRALSQEIAARRMHTVCMSDRGTGAYAPGMDRRGTPQQFNGRAEVASSGWSAAGAGGQQHSQQSWDQSNMRTQGGDPNSTKL